MRILKFSTNDPKIVGIWILLFSFALFILFSVVILNNITKAKRYVHTKGIVIGAAKNSGDTYSKIIEYYDSSGKKYSLVELSSSSIKPKAGKEIPVAYNPDNPSEAISFSFSEFFLLPIIIVFFALFSGIIGIFFLRSSYSDNSRKMLLIKNGNLIYADLLEVEFDYGTSINSRNPYKIKAKADIGKKEIIFESESIWDHPESLFPDKKVPVYIDPLDPQNYYVDVKKNKSEKSC